MSIEIKVSKRPISYKFAINFLSKRVEKVKKNKASELLWILEHPLTYTGGVSFDNRDILDKKITITKTNRGGKITVHNKGQKIVYIVLNLNNRKKDIKNLINVIENNIIEFLNDYKIKGVKDKKNIGIWVKNKKIAAVGIRVSGWIAYHGYSINIDNNLQDYLKINPCGLNNRKITSIFNEKNIKIKNVNKKIIEIFLKNLNKI